jgi:hypothetical protein
MSTSPEGWTHWLALAAAVHNNRKNSTTGLLLNQTLLGYELKLIPSEMPPSNNVTAQQRVETLLEKRAQAVDAINQSAKKGQVIPSHFKINDQVWLEASNLKLRHQKTKLAPK